MKDNCLWVMGNGFFDSWPLTDIIVDGYLEDKVFEQNGKQYTIGSCLMASMQKDLRYKKMCVPIAPGHQGYHYLTGSSNGWKEIHERYGFIFL